MNWYAIYTHSTFEKRVKRDIEHRASIEGLREKLGQIIIPEEKFVEIKEGKKKESTRSLMPGYVFVQMEGDDNLIKIIREVNGVSQFVGPDEKPSLISEEEIKNILGLIEDKHEKPKPEIKFRKGDQVKVIDGPFSNFIGTVDDIDQDRSRLKVMVSIFGRATPVDLGVLEVEKAT